MALQEEFERSGNWLFRWRGRIPLLIVPLLLFALKDAERIEKFFGEGPQRIWEVFCIGLSFAGFLIRCLTIAWIAEGTSGRNTKGQVADALNTQGIYSVIRHPLYVGNFLIVLGMILFIQAGWVALLYVLCFVLFYERIIFTEEAFLRNKFHKAFTDWADSTPLLWPDFKKWKSPNAPFSWKRILKREYSTFLGLIVAFIGLKFGAEFVAEGEFRWRASWLLMLAFGSLVYFVLRTLRKNTRLLN